MNRYLREIVLIVFSFAVLFSSCSEGADNSISVKDLDKSPSVQKAGEALDSINSSKFKEDSRSKVQKNTLSLNRNFSTPAAEMSQSEKSERAKRILAENSIHPHAMRELTHSLKSIKDLVGKIEEKASRGENPAIEITYLQTKYESLKDLDKKVKNNLSVSHNKDKNQKAFRAVQDRDKNYLARYKKTIKTVFNYLEDILKQETNAYRNRKITEIAINANFLTSIRALGRYLEEHFTFEPQKPKIAPSKLPLRSSDFKPITPDTTGKIVPAYLLQKSKKQTAPQPLYGYQQPTSFSSPESAVLEDNEVDMLSVAPPVSEDLEETVDVVITQEMRDLVASLNNSPARIYEWVKNTIEVEFYYGSLKGSLGTFLERAGNDTDISSLLLALYRAANIPCRYITGTIDIPVDNARSLTGIDYAENIGTLFASAGIPATTFTTSGGEIVFFRVEHTWTEAFVDYDPYAGAKAGEGDTWVPLSPWYKFYDYQDDMDLLTIAGFDTDAFLDDQISEIKKESPSELFKMFFEDYLEENDPGHNWQDGLRTKTLKKERFRTLPNTENFTVVSYNGEYAELPDGVRHKVTIAIPQVGLSHTFNICEIVAKKLTYSYPPADQASKDLINDNGGIENVHPLSVNLLPSLKLEGATVATGSVVNAGYYHTLQTTFIVPSQASQSVGYSVVSGAYYALGIDPQFVSNKYLSGRIKEYISTVGDIPETTDNMDEITGEALYLAVMKYLNDCYAGDRIFAKMLKDVFLKQTSGSITGKNLTVWFDMFGNPTDLEDGGFFVDSPHNIYTPISTTGDDSRELDFMSLSGYNGSFHEHYLFEHFFNLNAISTMKLLSIANEQGMPIYDIDSSNIGSILPILGLSNDDKSAIQNAVNQGHVVKVHQDPLTVGNWSGAGYIDRNPTDNSAGYMISGGWAGGATVDPDTGEIIVNGERTGTYLDGEPVNVANGNLFETEEDFSIPSRGMPITFVRYYNSQSDYNGPIGYGWTHNYNQHVTENPDESVIYFSENGGEFTFTRNPDGSYQRPAGFFSTLIKDGSDFTLRDKHGTEKNFDASGKLTSIEDKNGNTITFEYTGNNLTKIIDTVGREYILTYNMDNQLESIATPGSFVWEYTYNNDNLESATRPGNYTRNYTYYSDHNLASIIDARNMTTSFDYYSDDKVHTNYLPNGGTYVFSYNAPLKTTTVVDPEGNVNIHYYNEKGAITGHLDSMGYEELYEYDDDLNQIKVTDKDGGITKNTYDSMGNLLSTSNQGNYTTTFTYDPVYNYVLTVADPEDRVTTKLYDSNGNLEHIIYPPVDGVSSEVLFEYDEFGQLTLQTDENSNQTKFEYYEDTGYLHKIISDYGDGTHFNNTSEFTYDDAGKITSIKDAKNNVKTIGYEYYDRITQIISPAPFNYFTNFQYDENGNLLKTEKQTDDPLHPWQTVTSTYTSMDQLETTVDDLGNTTSYQYNLNNQIIAKTDAEDNTTQFSYNASGLLEETIDALGHTTARYYTPTGKTQQLIDAIGRVTEYEYDALNQMVLSRFPDGSEEVFQYDSLNNIIHKITRKGDAISYDYDALSRLILKTYPDSSTVSYSYDKGSRLVSVEDVNGMIQYEYDGLNRVISTTYPSAMQVGYEYDELGNRTKLTYPDGTYITYQHDELGRLTDINSQTGDTLVSYDYNPLNLRKTLTLLNGSQSIYQYNQINQLLYLVNQASDLSNISEFGYAYDKVGNRTSMATMYGTHNYYYDDKYQLTNVDYPDGHAFDDADFTYDKVGNRLYVEEGGGAVNYSVNNINQYTSVEGIAYTYDGNGNLTANNENTYEYDYENRLIAASNLSHASIIYKYDPFGRRIEKNVDGVITKYIYDGDQVICETDENDVITAKYVYGGGIDEVIMMQRGGSTYFYHYDSLGNVTDITDESGSKVESYAYDVYGRTNDSSSIGNPYMFTGRRFDAETGLYHYRSRYYDPSIGRFLQTDKLGYYDNINLYSYVGNNPLNWVDPFGLCKDDPWWKPSNEPAQWWADKWVETGNPLYVVGGLFASLWTPDTWWKTTAVLGVAAYLFCGLPAATIHYTTAAGYEGIMETGVIYGSRFGLFNWGWPGVYSTLFRTWAFVPASSTIPIVVNTTAGLTIRIIPWLVYFRFGSYFL